MQTHGVVKDPSSRNMRGRGACPPTPGPARLPAQTTGAQSRARQAGRPDGGEPEELTEPAGPY